MPPDPLGGKALRALPILCPGVKLSCPPVHNLNEPPGEYVKMVVMSICFAFRVLITQAQM